MIGNLMTMGMDRVDFILLFGHQIGYTSVLYYLLLFAAVIIYYLLPKKARWFVLFAASGLFYCWLFPETRQAALFGATIGISWICGILIHRTAHQTERIRRGVLITSIAVTALPLLFMDAMKMITSVTGTGTGIKSLIIPVGLSFYTLQIIAYLVDIYLKKTGSAMDQADAKAGREYT